MSEPATRAQAASPGYARRALGFALACLLLGPPVGASLIMLAIPVVELIASRGGSLARFSIGELGNYIGSILIAAIVSFLFGGLPALASAIWVGMRTYRFGRFGYVEAVLVSLISTLVLAPFTLPGSADPRTWTLGTLMLPASLVSALIVRWMLGRWMR